MLKAERHSDICKKLQVWPEIPNTRQLQQKLLESVTGETWAEANTRQHDKDLWAKPRIARLPAEEARAIYQRIIPLDQHAGSSAKRCLTTTEGLKTIQEIAARHQIPVTTLPQPWGAAFDRTSYVSVNPSSQFLHCPNHGEYQGGVLIPLTFTGDDMGDGNSPVYIQVIPFSESIYAIPCVSVTQTITKSNLDSRAEHYTHEWTIEDSVSQKVKFDARSYHLCQTHRADAKKLLLERLRKEKMESTGVKQTLIPNRHYAPPWLGMRNEEGMSVGKLIQETSGLKIKLHFKDEPVCLYDPTWIPS